jgi:ATP-dependent RNA helicase DeaD
MDHLRRGTLSLTGLKTVVLDEADEMLRMGFIDDVEWILARIPGPRQTALFSATMPREIRRIAERHVKNPPARLAREDRPLEVAVERLPAGRPRPEDGMVRLFIDAGHRGGVRPADIVGAIAREAGFPGTEIGVIGIGERFTFVEVPEPYRDQVLERMAHARIRNCPVRITLARPGGETREAPRRRVVARRPGAASRRRPKRSPQ